MMYIYISNNTFMETKSQFWKAACFLAKYYSALAPCGLCIMQHSGPCGGDITGGKKHRCAARLKNNTCMPSKFQLDKKRLEKQCKQHREVSSFISGAARRPRFTNLWLCGSAPQSFLELITMTEWDLNTSIPSCQIWSTIHSPSI